MSDNSQDYNRGGFIAFIFTMVFVVCFFIYLIFIHPGVDLGENVQDVNMAAGQTQEVKFDITKVTEPWVENADVAKYGATVYQTNCSMCHGDKGLGDGAAGAALNPKPRNLVEGQWKNGGDSISLFNTLTNGLAGTSMPAFAQVKKEDRWALVQFIRSITQNKSQDDENKLKAFGAESK